MIIIVCVKQVPNIAAIKFDREKKTIVREGVPLEVSSFDVRALLKAIDLVKEHGGEVIAITMGPPQAKSALEHCLALGAHRAIHLCDRAFAGADTLATARTLAMAIRREKYDLVFCGRWTVDAETAQVGPELAEFLSIPQATGARSIAFNADRTVATVERETDEGFETVNLPLPLLLTAAEDLAPERFPTRKDREAAKTRPIAVVTAMELSPDPSIFGQAGSPTTVKDILTIESKRACTFVEGATPDEKARRLVAMLLERGLFAKTWKGPAPNAPAPLPRGRAVKPDRAVWVVAEIIQGRLRRVTLELLGQASDLARRLEGEVAALLVGYDVDRHVKTLGRYGADRVYLADSAWLAPYQCELHAGVIADAIRELKPHSILFGSTSIGRDLAPRLAARLGLGLTSDCIGLEIDEQGRLVQHKPAFGGNIVAPILSRTFPQMATVRPGVLHAARPDENRAAEIIPLVVREPTTVRTKVLSVAVESGSDAADLETSTVVVGVGTGIGGPENLPLFRELCAVMGGALATTRDVTDKGWLPRQHQVGLTGKSIAPRFYFAIGIRGAFEHTVGIRKAGTIVAINTDDQAWIWDSADLGVKGDWKEIVPPLKQALIDARLRP